MTVSDPDPRQSSRLGRGVAVVALLAFVALLGYGLLAKQPNNRIDDALSRGETVQAPAFDLAVLEPGRMPPRLAGIVERAARDGRVALRELRGAPLVLNIWASWCPPCRDEAPVLERVWRETGPDGVLFVGLNTRDVRGDARAFLRKFKASYLNIREGDKTISRRYGATGLPETFFINREGQIVGHVIGAVSLDQLRAGARAARSSQARPAVRGGARRTSP